MNVKKILLTAVCFVAVAAISVMGTLAYLTDSTEIVNTFTMGNVSIKLDEANVDASGKIIAEGETGAGRNEEGNAYKLIPGAVFDKDPTVTVLKESEPSFVRMLLTLNCITAADEIFAPEGIDLNTLFGGYDAAKWVYTGEERDAEADTITYEFRYHTTVGAPEENVALEPLFTTFNVPAELNGDDLKALEGFKITVTGHAIQGAGFETADAAWTAFDAEMEAENADDPADTTGS